MDVSLWHSLRPGWNGWSWSRGGCWGSALTRGDRWLSHITIQGTLSWWLRTLIILRVQKDTLSMKRYTIDTQLYMYTCVARWQLGAYIHTCMYVYTYTYCTYMSGYIVTVILVVLYGILFSAMFLSNLLWLSWWDGRGIGWRRWFFGRLLVLVRIKIFLCILIHLSSV